MNNNDKYVEASKRERFHFNQLCIEEDIFNEDKGYTILTTPEDGYDKYDFLIQKYSPQSYICEKRYIVEVKVRNLTGHILKDAQDNGWILETKKLNSLLEVQKLDKEKNDIIYISFNGTYTYIWNITSLMNKGLLEATTNRSMNKATMSSRDNKVNKKVYMLKEEWGKRFDYEATEENYLSKLRKDDKLKRIRESDTKETNRCIFDALTKINTQ